MEPQTASEESVSVSNATTASNIAKENFERHLAAVASAAAAAAAHAAAAQASGSTNSGKIILKS